MYFPLKLGIFHGYVSLPEGINQSPFKRLVRDVQTSHFFVDRFQDFHAAVTFHDFTLVPLNPPSMAYTWRDMGTWKNSSLPGLAIKMCLENLGKYHFLGNWIAGFRGKVDGNEQQLVF